MISVMTTVSKRVLNEYNQILRDEQEYDLHAIDADGVGECQTEMLQDVASEQPDKTKVVVSADYLIEEVRWNLTVKCAEAREEDYRQGYISKARLNEDNERWNRKYRDFRELAMGEKPVEAWKVCEIEEAA